MDLKYAPHIERRGMFYAVIEKFVDAAISVSVKKEVLFRAVESFKFPKNVRHTVDLKNPYYWGFSGLIALSLRQREWHPEILKRNPDIFLDHQQEEARCIKGCEELRKNTPIGFPGLIGSSPEFRDDESFMPLQAADMYAFWVRKWESEGDGLQKLHDMNFPWPKTKNIPRLYMRFVDPYITPQLRGMFYG